MTRSTLLVFFVWVAVPHALSAQVTSADSLDVLAHARAAQAAFERERRGRLPWVWGQPRSGREEVVGRIVLLDDGDDDRRPGEPPEIGAARRRLLGVLDSLGALLPGDDWIAGQRVHYWIEAGQPRVARAALASCAATGSWCHALHGYARHADHDFVAAEASFGAALAAMSDRDRARWLAIEPLLDSAARRALDRAEPAERRRLVARFWWLADPFYSVPGNDRRSAHFSRHVQDRILENARSPFDIRWGDDLREVVLRYGWPSGWERARPRGGLLGASARGGVIGHDPVGERRFAPAGAILRDPFAVERGAWRLEPDGAPTTYAPAYTAPVTDLEHQLAVFQRGDSLVVVAGWRTAATAADAALVVTSSPEELAIGRAAGGRPTASLRVARRPAVVSVEAPATGRRARYGLPHASGPPPSLSDLLLVDGPTPAWPTLTAVAPRARGSMRVAAGDSLTLFWEIYPHGRRGSVHVSVTLRDERGGFWRGLGRVVGIGNPRGTTALAWSERLPAGAPVAARAVRLDLPRVPAGDYALEVAVRFSDDTVATSRREIVLENAGASAR